MPRPFFHKLILRSTIHSKQLRIPENFIKKIGDNLSAVAKLTIPDGHVWHVGLKKVDNKLCFQDGWHEFVERYSIRVGYILVFRYEGNSTFSVYIFNLTASEINYQSTSLSNTQGTNYYNHNHLFEEMEDDDLVEFLPSSTPLNSGPLRNKFFGSPSEPNMLNGSKVKNCINFNDGWNLHLSRGADNLQDELQFTRNVGAQISATDGKKSAGKVKLQTPDDSTKKSKTRGRKKQKIDSDRQQPSVKNEEEGENGFRFYESATNRKRTVTAEERERAVNAAKAFEPPNLFCRVVLKPSYLYRGCIMYLPSSFAKNLNGLSGSIKLIFDGKQWSVRCRYNGGGGAKLSQGWYEFCLDNNLGEGDVCVFEALKMNEIVLKVTVFRVAEDSGLVNPLPPPPQSLSQTKLFRN